MSTCAHEQCDRAGSLVRGLCSSHYDYHYKRGTLPPRKPKPTPAERFWAKVNKTADCWLWTAHLNGSGYGEFRLDGKARRAHRVAYQWLVGPIPAELVIDHLCKTPACVNPAHMEPVSQRVNVLRGDSPAARQARQTHCKNGHEFTPENTITDRKGKRRCRPCNAVWQKARDAA